MKTMKKLFMAAIAAAFIGTVLSCPNPVGSGGKKTEPDPDNNGNGTKTAIVFDNTENQCTVSVYAWPTRTDEYKIADVPAGSSSGPIECEWAVGSNAYTFYLTYLIPLSDDMVIPYIPDPKSSLYSISVRIDAGKENSGLICSLPPSPDRVTDNVYLLLHNEARGGGVQLANKSGSPLTPESIFGEDGKVENPLIRVVNYGERAWYIIDSDSAGPYSIDREGVQIPLPGTFEKGHWYTFRYTDGGLVSERDQAVSLDWLLDRPTVTFDADGGNPAGQTRTVDNGASVGAGNMPAEPEKSGYVFGGWYTARNGAGSAFTEATPVNVNITVYAKWTVIQYTVTFDADGGSPAGQTRTVDGGASLGEDMPPEPAKTEYAFAGWYTAPGGGGTEFTATTVVGADMTVYARWSVILYTVTFDADGGSPATQPKPINDLGIVGTSNMPREPARANYTFDGWYTERNGGGTEFYVDMPITGNVTMYAKWKIIQYTVTFNADGGSPSTQTRAVNSGAYVGTPNMPSRPAKSGSIFGGWYTEQNGGGSQFYVDTVVTNNTTVYAKWTLDTGIKYTVTFDADGGSPTPTPLAVSNGGSADSNMPADPSKSGYVFGGWYTAPNGGGTQFTPETTVLDNITVYAKWAHQYTVSFNAEGGNPAPASMTVLGGNSVGVTNMPIDPARTHYTFGGWYTAPNGGGTQFTASTTVSGDITVYAKWTIIQYTVTFNADGGSPVTQARTINSGGSASSAMPGNPSRTHYTFGGWYTAPNGGGTAFTTSTTVNGNMTVYAKWTAIQYTVTFNADGSNPATQSRTVNSGSSVGSSMPANPARTHYTFGGWYTAASGGGTQFTTSTTVNGNITVYAKWTIIQYTVTFNPDGGSPATATRTVNSGSSVGSSMPDNPSRTHYTFGGWYPAPNGGGTQFTASTTVNGNITVYAKWTIIQYTVTFNADGGSPATQTKTVNSGSSVGSSNMPANPTKSGYGFGGWYTAANGGGTAFTDSTTVNGSITVYAKWTDIYTVTFNADGGSPATATRTVNGGSSVGSSNMPARPAKNGSIFGGWYTAPNGGGSQFYVDTVVTNNTTVYAKWTLDTGIKYTVTFDADGGSPASTPLAVSNGGSAGSNIPADPARSGYAFGGWYTAKGGGGTRFTPETTVLDNITVYAKWTRQYTVSFNADGGSPAPASITVLDGNSGVSNMPADPSRAHYTFGGWYTAANGGGTEFTASTTVSGNMTVYAKWTAIQYTVTFNADGGSPATQSRTVNSGGSAGSAMPADPARSGYVFGGWYTAANGGGTQFTTSTTVNGNITVYAKWTIIQYTVTFNADGGSPATQTKTVNGGSSVGSSMPANPSKTHYTFGGWYTAANGGGTAFTASTVVTSNITVYAKWTIIQYTVTFNADGGSPATQTKTVNGGSSVGSSNMPADPSRAHYTFGGWYTAANGGGTAFTASTVVTSNITVYANWTITQYTVTFNADGGSPPTQTKTVNGGSSAGSSMPANPVRTLYTFDGWYTAANGGGTAFTASTVVTSNITVYANWTPLPLNDALIWISTHATEGGAYTITLTRDETIAPKTLSYSGKNVSVTIRGDATNRTVNLSSSGSLFTVESGVTLTLDNNAVLQGRSDNNASLVRVNSGGKLVMNTGSKISGNTSSSSSTYSYGGGVYVTGGTFTMSGGEISGNKVSSSAASRSAFGGGVYVGNSGTFTMNGGKISSNTASSSSSSYGGGVCVRSLGTFTMSGGEISGNTASSGGGVYVESSTFMMSGGEISGNTASSTGGGVYVESDTFMMSGGEISGNTAFLGGGVFVNGGTFTKQSGGIIYGSDAGDTLKNTADNAVDSYGHAVYVRISPNKIRNSTAGVNVTLDSTKDGSDGGWE